MARKKFIIGELSVGLTSDLMPLIDFASDLKKVSPSLLARLYITQGLVAEGIPQLYAAHVAAKTP
jgi:hypothetical protein